LSPSSSDSSSLSPLLLAHLHTAGTERPPATNVVLRLRRHTPLAMGAAPYATAPSSFSTTNADKHARQDRHTRSTVVVPPLVVTRRPTHGQQATSPHCHHAATLPATTGAPPATGANPTIARLLIPFVGTGP
jgi:hypothetical protein